MTDRAASTAEWRVRWAQISAQIDLHRQGLLATSKRRARQGDLTVAPQYYRFLPAKVRTQVARCDAPQVPGRAVAA